MTNQISLKRIQKNFFQIVDKCVLFTYKYDLHVGRPRIVENDPYTSIVLYFRHYFCSHCVKFLLVGGLAANYSST